MKRTSKFISVLLLAVLGLNVAADSQPPPFNYKIDLLQSRAQRGNQIDQFILGQAYMTGNKKLQKNVSKGLYWLTESAKQDHVVAQAYLAEIYHYADDVPQDHHKAYYWFKKAANNGDPVAQDYLALYYLDGKGVTEKDIEKALHWLKIAIKNGNIVSEANMVWILSTCADARYRDGKKALLMAMDLIARKGYREANDLDNLAAAYAETGDFKNAIQYQKQALEMLNEKDDASRKERFSKRLELYVSGKKFRE